MIKVIDGYPSSDFIKIRSKIVDEQLSSLKEERAKLNEHIISLETEQKLLIELTRFYNGEYK